MIEALDAPVTLRMDNRVPPRAPTFLAVCAPTEQQRLIVVVCTRADLDEPWTIRGARESGHERAGDVEEVHVMNEPRNGLAGITPDEAAAYAMDHDLGEMFDQAEIVRERRPAKMVTALRMDLGVQAEIEEAAAARGIGASTLMRQIIEEWVAAHRDSSAPDQLGELVRHLDAARRAADSLAERAT